MDITIRIQATEERFGGNDIMLAARQSEKFTNSIELDIDGNSIHVDKEELKKVISILCD